MPGGERLYGLSEPFHTHKLKIATPANKKLNVMNRLLPQPFSEPGPKHGRHEERDGFAEGALVPNDKKERCCPYHARSSSRT